MGRPRETDYESMTRDQLLQRFLMIRAQWRDRAMRKRVRDEGKAHSAWLAAKLARQAHQKRS